jgi:hypothetical protein
MMVCANVEVLILLHPTGVNPAKLMMTENDFS